MRSQRAVITGLTLLLSLLLTTAAPAQSLEDLQGEPDLQIAYPLLLVHHPARLSTMKQFDQNYFSTYRILSREVTDLTSPSAVVIVQAVASLFTLPLSHEEGHRSVLTTQRIGSISRPFFDIRGVAYVEGVTDETLMNLRDRELPTYVRLHTAGLESDYALGNQCSALAAFEQEEAMHIYVECTLRRVNHAAYLASAAVPLFSTELEEEDDELDRDIVGHDVLGAIRHLHRPNGTFYRYTDYDDLTDEEENFGDRVGLRALANLVNPFLLARRNWELSPGLKVAGGLGYSLAPFGDFIDENVWLLVDQRYRIHAYARQLQNRNHWFPAAGVNVSDLTIAPWLHLDSSVQVWRQPVRLDFNTGKGRTGGLVGVVLKYDVLRSGGPGPSVSVDAGITAKSRGFAPEESYLDHHIGGQLGTTIRY